jgi:hypothetical protein
MKLNNYTLKYILSDDFDKEVTEHKLEIEGKQKVVIVEKENIFIKFFKLIFKR